MKPSWCDLPRAAERSGLAAEGGPDAYTISKLRAEILELGSVIRQLQRVGLDEAAAQLLIVRKGLCSNVWSSPSRINSGADFPAVEC